MYRSKSTRRPSKLSTVTTYEYEAEAREYDSDASTATYCESCFDFRGTGFDDDEFQSAPQTQNTHENQYAHGHNTNFNASFAFARGTSPANWRAGSHPPVDRRSHGEQSQRVRSCPSPERAPDYDDDYSDATTPRPVNVTPVLPHHAEVWFSPSVLCAPSPGSPHVDGDATPMGAPLSPPWTGPPSHPAPVRSAKGGKDVRYHGMSRLRVPPDILGEAPSFTRNDTRDEMRARDRNGESAVARGKRREY